MAEEQNNFLEVGTASVQIQDTAVNKQQYQKLGLAVADSVNANANYMLNMAKLDIQQQQISQVNSWIELQKDIEIKNIEQRTGQMVSAQTSAYGFSGVTMSGSAVDTTLRTLEVGAKEKIYAEINFAFGQIQREYQSEMTKIAERSAKMRSIANTISSVTSAVSNSKFGGGNATGGATDAQSKAASEKSISDSFAKGTVNKETGAFTSPSGQVFNGRKK